mmetsp:Transcript_44734/g.103461  ORF Transcript_44734/g.103461 Transcript_44734/m.103461 type:complete len:490 (-) Transcript_44734:149-1618(-)
MFGAQSVPLQHGAFFLPPMGGQMPGPPAGLIAPPAGMPFAQPGGFGDMFAGMLAGAMAPQLDEKEQAVDACLRQQGGFAVARQRQSKPALPPGALGKGAFGVVYLANQNGVDYAVKLVEGLSKNKKLIAQEIEILRILEHPSVVNLVCSWTEEARDWMFIVMDFVDGGDLQNALSVMPQMFDEALIRALLFHSSCALAYAHHRSVVHRDLKPENILLRKRDFLPKIADFGISRVIGAHSVCKTMAGTLPYMAPEVTDQSSYTFSADMYSLGKIVVDMLHPQRMVSWLPAEMMHPSDQQRFRKQFPPGTGPCAPSSHLSQVSERLLHIMPGKRHTAHNLCKELVKMQKHSPRPHVLWSEPTKVSEGPPPSKGVTAEAAAQIAAARGYAVDMPVEMKLAEGVWVPGTVEHISLGLCPGAAQIRYNANGKVGSALVCPWQFQEILRPGTLKASESEEGLPEQLKHKAKSVRKKMKKGLKQYEDGLEKCCSIQ